MERSEIRERPCHEAILFLDSVEFIIGPAEGWTRWLHAGYGPPPAPYAAAAVPFGWTSAV